MALNLAKTVLGHLKDRPDEKLTARQIVELIFATFPGECQAKKHCSQYLNTDGELVQQLVAEISSPRPRLQNRHPELKTTEGVPPKCFDLEKLDDAEVAAA